MPTALALLSKFEHFGATQTNLQIVQFKKREKVEPLRDKNRQLDMEVVNLTLSSQRPKKWTTAALGLSTVVIARGSSNVFAPLAGLLG